MSIFKKLFQKEKTTKNETTQKEFLPYENYPQLLKMIEKSSYSEQDKEILRQIVDMSYDNITFEDAETILKHFNKRLSSENNVQSKPAQTPSEQTILVESQNPIKPNNDETENNHPTTLLSLNDLFYDLNDETETTDSFDDFLTKNNMTYAEALNSYSVLKACQDILDVQYEMINTDDSYEQIIREEGRIVTEDFAMTLLNESLHIKEFIQANPSALENLKRYQDIFPPCNTIEETMARYRKSIVGIFHGFTGDALPLSLYNGIELSTISNLIDRILVHYDQYNITELPNAKQTIKNNITTFKSNFMFKNSIFETNEKILKIIIQECPKSIQNSIFLAEYVYDVLIEEHANKNAQIEKTIQSCKEFNELLEKDDDYFMDNFDLLAAPTCWSTVCIGQISPLKYYTEHVIPLTKMSFPCPEQIVQQYTSAYTPFDEITLYKNEEKIATLSPEEYTAKKKKFVSYINSEIKDMHFTLKDNLDENYMDLEYSYVRCRSKNNDKSASFGDKN